MIPELSVVITDPDGLELDVSARLVDGASTIERSVEDALLQLTHGDADIELDDRDGEIEKFFRFVEPGDVYELAIWRETLKRRPKWDLLFNGLLDLPWSLTFDRKEQTANLVGYSFTKLLEESSAEDVRRTDLTGKTGSVTGGTNTVTLSPDEGNIAVGDEITLKDSSNEETQTVATVGSGTATTVDNWSNTFSAAELTVETPYYRNKTISFLAGELFGQAGIDNYEIETGILGLGFPFGSAVDGAEITPGAVWIEGAFAKVESGGNVYAVANPGDVHTDEGAGSQKLNWREYLDAEPSTILTGEPGAGGVVGADHTNGDSYTLLEKNDTPGVNDHELWIQKNGSDWVLIDSFTDTLGEGYIGAGGFIEFEPTHSRVWYSFKRSESALEEIGFVTTGTSQTVISNAAGSYGNLQRLNGSPARMAHLDDDGVTLDLREIDGVWNVINTVTVPAGFKLDSLFAFDNKSRAAALYADGSGTHVIVWTIPDWTQEGTYKLTNASTGAFTATNWTPPTNEDLIYGYAGDVWFIVSRSFGGVVPYANFEGMDCGAALRDLAILAAGFVEVDEYRNGIVRPRDKANARTLEPETLGTPLEQESLPLSEYYRTSANITGETDAGVEIDVLVGTTGDSSARLEVSSPLISSIEVAQAVGNAYLAIFSVVRTQENVTLAEEDTGLIRPFEQVKLDGTTYAVYGMSAELDDRELELVLVEV